MSFFADFTYEGSRGILGPYLALLGASGTVVGVVTGFGELAGYGLRLVSGRLTDRTRQFWPITIFGYIVQMAAVPALALAHSWPAAAALLILERVGKAIRNPPRDVMNSASHLNRTVRVRKRTVCREIRRGESAPPVDRALEKDLLPPGVLNRPCPAVEASCPLSSSEPRQRQLQQARTTTET